MIRLPQRSWLLPSVSFWLALTMVSGLFPISAWAADFAVSTPAELQAALDEAAGNGEDDAITLTAGEYRGNFSFTPRDGASLSMAGEEGTTAADVLLDGDASGAVLSLVCTGVDSTVRLEGLTFRNGTESGLHVYARERNLALSLHGIVIRDNSTDYMGGGMHLRAAANSNLEVELWDSVVSHNQSVLEPDGGPGRGGGIYAYSGYGNAVLHLTISNSIIANNRARSTGGGLEVAASEVGGYNVARGRVVNSTITGNVSNAHNLDHLQDEGGGIRVYGYSGEEAYASLDLYNTIVHGNIANGPEASEDLYVGQQGPGQASVDAYHSDIGEIRDPQGLYEATEVINADPLFFGAETGDFHLRAGSPCIDAGTTEILGPYGLPANDIDGDPRIIGPAPDIGADEASRPAIYLPLLLEGNTGDLTHDA